MLKINSQGSKEVPIQQTKTVQERPFTIVLSTRRDCEAMAIFLNALAQAGYIGTGGDKEAEARARELGSSIGGLIVSNGHLPRSTQLTANAKAFFGLK